MHTIRRVANHALRQHCVPPASRRDNRCIPSCRRLAKDFENLTRNALAVLRLASISSHAKKALSELMNFPTDPQSLEGPVKGIIISLAKFE